MSLEGRYEPSPVEAVRRQVEDYEATDGRVGGTHRGLPVVILATHGARTGALRKTPLMRIEHEGTYAVVASFGGAPAHPLWYRNILADPAVALQDGALKAGFLARELMSGTDECAIWWDRAFSVFPRYADYRAQLSGRREVPLVLLEQVHGRVP